MVGPGKHEPFLVFVHLGVCYFCVSASYFCSFVFFCADYCNLPLVHVFSSLPLSLLCFLIFVFPFFVRYLALVYQFLSYNSSALLIFTFPTLSHRIVVVFHYFFVLLLHLFLLLFLFILFLSCSWNCQFAVLFFSSSTLLFFGPLPNNFHITMRLMGAIQKSESQRSGLTQQQ